MVSAWYLDNSDADPRLEHQQNPPRPVDIKDLVVLTGVLFWKLNVDTFEVDGEMDRIRKERGYSYEDVVELSPAKSPNYEQQLKIFFTEHLHTDEEIRFILAGSGYFDVRDRNDTWIRIEANAGDLIVMPAGIYHRFTLDSKNYIKAKRYFVGSPVWTAYFRPAADDMPARLKYLASMQATA